MFIHSFEVKITPKGKKRKRAHDSFEKLIRYYDYIIFFGEMPDITCI